MTHAHIVNTRAVSIACDHLRVTGGFRHRPITRLDDLHTTITELATLAETTATYITAGSNAMAALAEHEDSRDQLLRGHLGDAATAARAAALPVRHASQTLLAAAEYTDAAMACLRSTPREAALPRHHRETLGGVVVTDAPEALANAVKALHATRDAHPVTVMADINGLTADLAELCSRIAQVIQLTALSATQLANQDTAEAELLSDYFAEIVRCCRQARRATIHAHAALRRTYDQRLHAVNQRLRRLNRLVVDHLITA